MNDAPNILLILSDQHRADCLGANGHPFIRTPHLDLLASEGMNFTQAYTPIPVCVPARLSLLHGVWSTDHLAIANADTEAPRPPEAGWPSFSLVLRDGGYRLGFVGKWQVHPRKSPLDEDYAFHTYCDSGQYTLWRQAQGYPPRPTTQPWFGEADPHIPPEASRLAWGADQVIDWLRDAVTRQQPFFLRWDTNEPHLPNIVPEPYASLYPPQTIPPWLSYPDSLEGKPYIQRQQRRTWKLDHWTWDDWAPIVGRYLGEVSLLDTQIGRILATLDTLDLTKNTLVIYTSDHGDLCGGHGMIDKHFVMYDDVVRVPLIARWPGHIPQNSRCDAFVVHALDLAATLCDVAGVAQPRTFRGQSLLPLLKGAKDNGRRDVFSLYHGNQFGLYSQRMVRDRRWKYVWNATAEDELYDLVQDPGELRNRALDSDCQDELARLRQRMVAWMEEIRDPLLNVWTRAQLSEGLSR